jgi:hypothetical protein
MSSIFFIRDRHDIGGLIITEWKFLSRENIIFFYTIKIPILYDFKNIPAPVQDILVIS